MKPNQRILVVSLLLGAMAPSVCNGRTWFVANYIGSDFTIVQLAINAAQTGDTVLVAPGRYVENIRFQGRDIVLKSMQGPEVTVLDGSFLDKAVVEFRTGESNTCVLEGFTITGGRGSGINSFERAGAGVFVQDAEPTILGNVITENNAINAYRGGVGGGIFCRAAFPDFSKPLRRPRILKNTICLNVAGNNGGGIGLEDKASAEIIDNDIFDNVTNGGDGGGIWIIAHSSTEIIIDNNRIFRNRARDHGGGIYASNNDHYSQPVLHMTIRRNVISDNVAQGKARTGDSAGGMWLNCTNALVTSNTICGNRGEGPGNAYGGGIVALFPGSPLIERNIIALSSAGGGIMCKENATPIIQNNLVWANDGGDALGSCMDWVSKDGNLLADPLFCGASTGDYSLPPDSPAFSHPAGTIGAMEIPGCLAGVSITPSTWGMIKALFWEK